MPYSRRPRDCHAVRGCIAFRHPRWLVPASNWQYLRANRRLNMTDRVCIERTMVLTVCSSHPCTRCVQGSVGTGGTGGFKWANWAVHVENRDAGHICLILTRSAASAAPVIVDVTQTSLDAGELLFTPSLSASRYPALVLFWTCTFATEFSLPVFFLALRPSTGHTLSIVSRQSCVAGHHRSRTALEYEQDRIDPTGTQTTVASWRRPVHGHCSF